MTTTPTPQTVREAIARGEVTEARGRFWIDTIDAAAPEAFGVLVDGIFSSAWFVHGDFDAFGVGAEPIADPHDPGAMMKGLGWGNTSALYGAQGWATLTSDTGQTLVVVLGAEGTHRNEYLAKEAVKHAKSHSTSGLAVAVVCGTIWRIIDPGSPGMGSLYVDVGRAQPQFVRMGLSPDGILNAEQRQQVEMETLRYGGKIAERLQERVCQEALPILAEAFGREVSKLHGDGDLQTAFEAALRLIFRVLFVAYAEDADILPYRRNPDYATRSMTALGQRLAIDPDWNATDHAGTELLMWLKELWSTINDGDHSKGVPTYNGGLFDDFQTDDPVARLLARGRLRDAELSLALRSLLVEPASSENPALQGGFPWTVRS